MEPISNQSLIKDPEIHVNRILSFSKQICLFKESNPAENPQILQIYQNKDIDLNQTPSVWQTFLYSIRKFNEKPFDTGRQIFDIIFMIIFRSYYSSKHPDEVNSSQLSEKNIQKVFQGQMSKQNKKIKRGSNFTSNKDLKCQILLKELGWKRPQKIREWMKQSQKEIKEANNPIITNQEVRALIRQIKACSIILTFEQIINAQRYLAVINSKTLRVKSNKFYIYNVLIKHANFISHPLTSLQYKVWRHIKQNFYIIYAQTYSQSEKIDPVRFLNLIIKCFSNIPVHQQFTDVRFYMHMLHKAAEKSKHFLLADMIKTKCFICDPQRFATNSIQKIRIYQCLSRKILNSLSEYKDEGFMSSHRISQNQNPSNKGFFFD